MKNCIIALALTLLLLGCSQDQPAPATAQDDSPTTEENASADQAAATDDNPDAAADTSTDDDNTDAAVREDGGSAGASITKVNLNTATEEQFLALPEVTDRMAHEFDEYRPYASIRQFRREIGKYVDEAQVARYEQYVFVPIDINESDAETLQQIPGVTAEMAEAVIAMRPFDNTDEFLAALTGRVSADAVEIARTYLAAE